MKRSQIKGTNTVTTDKIKNILKKMSLVVFAAGIALTGCGPDEEENKPDIEASFNGASLVQGKDYTLSYSGDLVNVTADGVTVKKTSLERCRSIFGMTVGGETTLAVRSIDDASPAQKAGIAEGDELVAIAGIRVKKATWERLLVGICDSKKVRVELFRDDRLLSFDVHLRQALLQKYELLPKQGN